jgi:hypothetical protein
MEIASFVFLANIAQDGGKVNMENGLPRTYGARNDSRNACHSEGRRPVGIRSPDKKSVLLSQHAFGLLD